jgi:hypothetical protein
MIPPPASGEGSLLLAQTKLRARIEEREQRIRLLEEALRERVDVGSTGAGVATDRPAARGHFQR